MGFLEVVVVPFLIIYQSSQSFESCSFSLRIRNITTMHRNSQMFLACFLYYLPISFNKLSSYLILIFYSKMLRISKDHTMRNFGKYDIIVMLFGIWILRGCLKLNYTQRYQFGEFLLRPRRKFRPEFTGVDLLVLQTYTATLIFLVNRSPKFL